MTGRQVVDLLLTLSGTGDDAVVLMYAPLHPSLEGSLDELVASRRDLGV